MAKSFWGALGQGLAAAIGGAAASKVPNRPTSSGGGAKPSASGGGWSGSASGVLTNDAYQQQIKDQMNANSQAWHSASAAERERLEKENQAYGAQLGGSVQYDPNTGKWGGAAGQAGNGSNDLFEQWRQEQDGWYEQEQRRLEEANRAAVEQAVGGLNAQKQGVDQSYSDLFKELYVQRRMSEKNLPQQMAAMGYSGGLSESAALNLQNTYSDALRRGEQERLGTMSDIDRAVTDARLQGDANLANQAAQLAQNKFSSYSDLIQAQLAQQNLDKQFGYQQSQDALGQENWNKSFAYQQAQEEWNRGDTSYQRKLQLAQIMAQYGDFSGFSALGVDPTAMKTTYTSALGRSGGGGSGGGVSKPRLTASQALDAWNSGMDTPEVREAVSAYYGNIFGDAKPQGDSSAYVSVGRQIAALEDRLPANLVPSEALRIIKNAATQGLLTDAEVRKLAGQYGLSL